MLVSRAQSIRISPVVSALFVVLLVGCKRDAPQPGTTQPATAAYGQAAGPARRVISLAPSVTEIVFALGQGNRLVGVTSYCVYPPAAAKLPRCGGAMDTDLEKILTLRPDLILVHGQHETAVRFCRENNIRMLRTTADNLATLYGAIRAIGAALDCEDRAEELVSKIQAELDRIRAAVKGRPVVRVFLSMLTSPDRVKTLATTNGKGFVSETLSIAGGENIFASSDVFYPKIAASELLRRAPDVIIEMQPGRRLSTDERRASIEQWRRLGPIPAVANNRVYFITDDFAMIPGPRVPLLARRFAELLHPDLKGKLNERAPDGDPAGKE